MPTVGGGGLRPEGSVRLWTPPKGLLYFMPTKIRPDFLGFFERVKVVGGALATAAAKHSVTSKVLKIGNQYSTGHHLIVIIRHNRSDYVA